MPVIVVEQAGRRQTLPLDGELSIGRGQGNTLRIDHPLVSRDHAMIEATDAGFVLRDFGSRNGTKINDAKVRDVQVLQNGDRITVGPTTLWFRDSADTPLPEFTVQNEEGVTFDCTCGAKLWSPMRLSGAVVRCKRCRGEVQCPALFDPAAQPADAEMAEAATCSICLSAVNADEERHTCAGCGSVYHAECWASNLGCASYGCSHVNILSPDYTPVVEQADDPLEFVDEPDQPWDAAVFGASIIAALLGALAFGGLSLVTAIVAALYYRRRPGKLGLAAIGVSIAGLAGGAAVSYFYWLKP